MTEHSQNGWQASPTVTLRPFVVNGVSFAPGIRDDDDVETVLRYVLTQFDQRVEPLHSPGCWGFSYRPNRNDPNSLSNHASGTAVDANAPRHPNGVATTRTFTPAQVAEVHRILLEVGSAVRWGGDYHGTPDAMHFEINVDAATLRGVAEGLRDAMPYSDWPQKDRDALIQDISGAVVRDLLAAVVDGSKGTVKNAADRILKAFDRNGKPRA